MKKTSTPLFPRASKISIAVLCLLSAMKMNAQVSTTYSFTQSSGAYAAIAGGTVVANNTTLVNMDDNVFGPITMPTPFVFDGVSYNDIYISTNGFVAFGNAPDPVEYNPISGTDIPLGVISAFGGDLDAAGVGTPTIRYRTVGTEFIVQWTDVSRFIDADRIKFQIRLNNANNQIKIVYGGPVVMDFDATTLEVGLRGPNNTFPINVNNRSVISTTGSWVNSTAGAANTDACDFDQTTPTTTPTAGTTFIWTPPAVDLASYNLAAPSNVGCYSANTAVTINIINTGSATINFATNPVTVHSSVTGPNPTTFGNVILNSGTLAVNATLAVPITINYDMTLAGNYIFHSYTSDLGDLHTANDTMAPVTIYSHTPGIIASPDVSICTGATTFLTGTATAFPYDVSFNNPNNLNIPDNNPVGVNSTIAVVGVPIAPSLVSCTIDNLTHTFDGDLIFTLKAPNGSSTILSNQNGGGGANYTSTEFVGTATNPIGSGTAPFTGSWLPDNPMTNLTGSSNGNWILNVSDNAAADVGTLHSWTLKFSLPNSIVTYSWSPATGLSSTTIANPIAFPTTTTNYTVTVIDGSGCSNSDNVVVTVNPLPIVTATATPNPVCTGSTVLFTGGGASSYNWTGGVADNVPFTVSSNGSYTVTGIDVNGCINTANVSVTTMPLPIVTATSSAPIVCSGDPETLTGGGAVSYSWSGGVTDAISFNPTSTLTYTVTGTGANGCTNTATTTVTVNPLPSVTANSTAAAICPGGTVTLAGGGATTYTWTGGVMDAVAFNPLATNTYTVTGTDANGCMNTANTTVVVNSLPTVVANASSNAVCSGGSVTLSGSGATTYTWTGGVMDAIAFTPLTTGSYTVTGTDANGCMNIDSATITVNTLPTVVANTSAPAVCLGNPVTLTGSGATSYTWTGGVTDAVAFNPLSTSSYTVTGTDANGCMNIDSTTITVNALPNVTANSSAAAVCAGSPVTLTGGGATSYVWSNSVVDAVAFTPIATNTYTVTGTDANGCSNTATITVVMNDLPSVTLLFPIDTVCVNDGPLVLTGENPVGGAWSGTAVSGSNFTPSTAGLGSFGITYTYTDLNGCTNFATQPMTVDACTGVLSFTSNSIEINAYPNPSSGIFTLNILNSNVNEVGLEIFDLQGQLIYSEKLIGVNDNYSKQINLSAFANGSYFMKVTAGNTIQNLKVFKQE